MQNGSGGAGDYSLEEMQRQAIEHAIGEIAGFVQNVHPEVRAEVAAKAAERAVLEQQGIVQTVLADMLDPSKRLEIPRWGFTISAGPAQGRVMVAKDPRDLTSLESVSHYTHAIALASAPAARAVLYALGYQLEWHQGKGAPRIVAG